MTSDEEAAEHPKSRSGERGFASRVFRGAAWSSIGRLTAQAIQFSASLVLARILSPTDFGLYASVLVVTQFSALLFEMGLGGSLVHKRDLTPADLATVFWLNAISGIVLAAALAALAPTVAAFFDEPTLVWLTPLVALTFTLNIGVSHLALLQRSFRFKLIAVIEIAAASISFAVAIGAALLGFGVYSLGLISVVQSIVTSTALWIVVPWRPTLVFSRTAVARAWAFSRGLLAFNVADYWGRNADNLLIGRYIGVEALGLYNRAYNLMSLPVHQIGQVLGRVMFPALATMQSDPRRAAAAYRRSVRVLQAVTAPTLLGAAAVSPALVPALWGDAWLEMTPLLTVVCIAGVPLSLTTSSQWVYQAFGRTGTMFRMDLIATAFGIIAMAIGLRWGALGVAWGVAARTWIFSLPSLFVACRIVRMRGSSLVFDSLRTLSAAGLMGALVWFVPPLAGMERSSPAALLFQIAVGIIAYGALLSLVHTQVLRDLRTLRN